MKWIFFSLWSSNSNVTIYYYQYATGKISIFVRLTSEQFINLISPCNQKQRYLLQPLHWLHEWWRTLEQWFVSGNIQGWWCCMRKCWRFRNKSLGREAPYDWLLSNLSVIVVADRMLDSQTLPNKRNFWKSFYDYSKFSPSFVGDMVVFYLVHMIRDWKLPDGCNSWQEHD